MDDVTTFEPQDLWKQYEVVADSYDEVMDLIRSVQGAASSAERRFAWRGQVDSRWALSSGLYRRLLWRQDAKGLAPPQEETMTASQPDSTLQHHEQRLLIEAHRWGLHNGGNGRLSVMNQLAHLQHFGAATRLIDISFNALVGLWFAVEDQRQYSSQREPLAEPDGRLFAVDVAGRLINENDGLRAWEDDLDNPWRNLKKREPYQTGPITFHEWTTRAYAWRPGRLNERIVAQTGGFLLGGVPATGTPKVPFQIRSSGEGGVDNWAIADIRRAMSVALPLHQLGNKRGARPAKPAYTIRISSNAKAEIRDELRTSFGIDASALYPDFAGLGRYAFATSLPLAPAHPPPKSSRVRRVSVHRVARRRARELRADRE